MKIAKQAEQYPLQSPHYDDYGPEENSWEHQRTHEEPSAPRLNELPDSAYGGTGPQFGDFGQDGYDYDGMSRGEYNQRMRDWGENQDTRDEARSEQLARDEDTGYNWGPPPD